MYRVFRTIVLVTAGILVGGIACLAGLAAALMDWSRRPATLDSSAALPNDAALPTPLGQKLISEDWQTYAVQYGVVELGIPAEGSVWPATAFASPDNKPWYAPHFIARTLPPDDPVVLNVAPSQPGSAAVLESPGPEHLPSSQTKLRGSSKQPTALHRSSSRPGSVLNDAQIASIKARLKLTPDQESMWPPVETAPRNLSYVKNAVTQSRSVLDHDQTAYVDLNGAEVQQLMSVVLPLIMRLSEDQKREVKSLAHLMGFDGVAASF